MAADWGLVAQSSGRNAERILDTFWHVLRSEERRSPDWFDFVTDNIRGQFDMHVPSPGEYTEDRHGCLTTQGRVWSDVELRRAIAGGHPRGIDRLPGFAHRGGCPRHRVPGGAKRVGGLGVPDRGPFVGSRIRKNLVRDVGISPGFIAGRTRMRVQRLATLS